MIDFTSIFKLKEKLEPIFVPVKEEDDYCKKHKISRIKLDNGANILGIERPISDSVYTSIQFSFSSGSYFDPPDKQGLHHLTEHLFNRKLRLNTQDKKGIQINASTGSLELRENIGGSTNYSYPFFGLWPVISQTIQMLRSPVDQYEKPKEVLDGERSAVEKEIMERDSSQARLCFSYLSDLVLGKDNPHTASNRTLGGRESIADISIDDCRELTKKVIGADNLTASFMTDTYGKTTKEIEKRIAENLVIFPRVTKNELLDPMIKEATNTDFLNGNNYSFDTGLRDGKAIVFLVWLTSADPTLSNYWIRTSLIEDSIEKSFHLLSRKYGWSYSGNFEVIVPFWYQTIFATALIVPKNSADKLFTFSQEVEQKFKHELLVRLDERVVGGLIEEQRIQLLAQPIKQSSRLDCLIEGTEDYNGRIIDPERIREQRLQAGVKDVLFWRDYLAGTKPAVVVVGDIEG